jgi:hypothetical protein
MADENNTPELTKRDSTVSAVCVPWNDACHIFCCSMFIMSVHSCALSLQSVHSSKDDDGVTLHHMDHHFAFPKFNMLIQSHTARFLVHPHLSKRHTLPFFYISLPTHTPTDPTLHSQTRATTFSDFERRALLHTDYNKWHWTTSCHLPASSQTLRNSSLEEEWINWQNVSRPASVLKTRLRDGPYPSFPQQASHAFLKFQNFVQFHVLYFFRPNHAVRISTPLAYSGSLRFPSRIWLRLPWPTFLAISLNPSVKF